MTSFQEFNKIQDLTQHVGRQAFSVKVNLV